MKFLVDAQLPRRLARQLQEAGHDSLHTLDLPEGNRTTDAAVNTRADYDGRIVVTKDADFVNSHLLHRLPSRLLVISTGNITNRDLEALFTAHLATMVTAFQTCDYVELTRTNLILHA